MNKVVLMGRLTREPEVRYTQSNNMMITRFGLAVNKRFQREGEPTADFINVVVFGKTAEFCSKYFRKGQQVGVIGRISTSSYDNAEGKKVYVTEVAGEEAYFAEGRKDSEAAAGMNFAETFGTESKAESGGEFSNSPSEDDLPF